MITYYSSEIYRPWILTSWFGIAINACIKQNPFNKPLAFFSLCFNADIQKEKRSLIADPGNDTRRLQVRPEKKKKRRLTADPKSLSSFPLREAGFS